MIPMLEQNGLKAAKWILQFLKWYAETCCWTRHILNTGHTKWIKNVHITSCLYYYVLSAIGVVQPLAFGDSETKETSTSCAILNIFCSWHMSCSCSWMTFTILESYYFFLSYCFFFFCNFSTIILWLDDNSFSNNFNS